MLSKDALFYATMELFTEKGTKFTMDEVSKKLGISKRTLYENISSKEELSVFMVEKFFEIVEERQRPILEDSGLCAADKLRRLMTTTPSMPVGRLRMAAFRTEYPKAYALMDAKLSFGWESTFRVMDEGIAAGELRDFDKALFAMVYAAGIEALVTGYDAQSPASFNELQQRLVDILLSGICFAFQKSSK